MREIDKKAFRSLSYGLYIVTSSCETKANGQIANAVLQVTSSPPKIAVCLNKDNFTHQCIKESGWFGVSVLSEEVPLPFIGRFGFKSGRDIDKLGGVACLEEKTEVPLVIEHSTAVFEVKVESELDVGTHTLFVGRVTGAKTLDGTPPLTYAAYHEKKRGKTPPKAPTFQPD
jgi:ferric-chelate reductase [NAD(P)H]